MHTSKVCLFLTILLALGIDVRAQSDSREPTAIVSGKISIQGVPAAGLPVMLLKPNGPGDALPVARASTDAEGNYRLTGIAAGVYEDFHRLIRLSASLKDRRRKLSFSWI